MTQAGSLAGFVRRHDPDRYLTALFAPAERRETLFALYAFNHELARAWEVASQPTLALIRLQWWREVVEGAARSHEVATPLSAEIAAGRLQLADLLRLIEGREAEAYGFDTSADWQDFAAATAGQLAVAAGQALGADAASLSRLRALGTGYGIAGLLRSAGFLARAGRPHPPAEWRAGLAAAGAAALGSPQRMARGVVSAGLVGVLARWDLRRSRASPRGLGDRLAVAIAAARGVV